MEMQKFYNLIIIFTIVIGISLIIIAFLIRKVIDYREIILEMIDYLDDEREIDEIYREFNIQDRYLNAQIDYLKKKDGK